MSNFNRTIYYCFIILNIILCNNSNATCILPWTDAYRPNVSNRNLAGHLIEIKHGKALILEYKTKNRIYVDVSKLDAAYSAFGGDPLPSELKPEIAVRIWYKRCVKPKNGIPVAAYFEFFSNDPDDQPLKSDHYFTKKGY